ncbi:MAG: BamA/TamA family outer membrane protein [Lewinellaceae bacterium]|nr:BamA/TamA family outer membrane protein [Saprospiraceae bacterium]MCB9311543.1 BamA/TamA family outer membrane protein [Lewinellaceae bacterium]HRW74763.1 BamA/TamA family outer membrane protein [Saprospiraceae bacterium]
MALAILILGSSACHTYKYMPADARLVTQNRIQLKTPPHTPNRKELIVQLENLVSRKPNRKVLGLFDTYLWFYYRTSQPDDTTRWDKFVQGNLAEEPVYVDPDEIQDNLDNMIGYLRNRGYFQATGRYTVDSNQVKPTSMVTYQLKSGEAMEIQSFSIHSEDPDLQPLLPQLQKRTLIKPGKILDSDLYYAEANRITKFLREQGFAFFFLNQVSPIRVDIADTTDHRVNAFVDLLPDPGGRPTRPVRVNQVNILSSSGTDRPIQVDTMFKQLRIRDDRPVPYLRPEVLHRALSLRPDSLYKESSYDKANRRLSSLGIYRFVNIRALPDTLPDNLNLAVQLTPIERKALDMSVEVNNTTAIGDNSNVLGVSFSNSYTQRNILHRGIRMDFTLEPGVEFNFQPLMVNAANGIGKLDFNFPFFEDYLSFWRHRKENSFLGRWNQRFENEAKSNLSFSYTYNNLLGYWETQIMNVHYGFRYNPTTNFGVTLDHFQVDYYRNDLKEQFEMVVPEGFKNAFEDQFLTGFLFRSLTANYIAPINRFGESWSVKASFEQSGLEILGANTLYNLFDSSKPIWKAGSIGFAKYLRTDSQWTYSRKFGKGRQVATRFYGGIIVPLADDLSSPYIKQFSAGGPSSMRGWLNGELGPGSVVQTQTNPPFFSRGDVKLEANVEWRQSIFWILEGAAFLDAGNVWNLRDTPGQTGASLRDFQNEWAMAGGLGIRLNFQYFIIVYDVGAKLRYPYKVDGSHWARKMDVNFFNLLINYPF